MFAHHVRKRSRLIGLGSPINCSQYFNQQGLIMAFLSFNCSQFVSIALPKSTYLLQLRSEEMRNRYLYSREITVQSFGEDQKKTKEESCYFQYLFSVNCV